MKIAFGCDHTGIDLKNALMAYLESRSFECVNYGADDPQARTDYPVKAQAVTDAVLRGDADKGVLICGTGIGMSLAANKVPGIRACVCSEPYSAKLSVQHNDANILCLGARVIGVELAKMIVDAFFDAEFMGGHHIPRLAMITEIEKKYSSGS